MTLQLAVGGAYQATVFLIREGMGILESNVAYTEEIEVGVTATLTGVCMYILLGVWPNSGFCSNNTADCLSDVMCSYALEFMRLPHFGSTCVRISSWVSPLTYTKGVCII